ncbi:MAG: hypothetical protein KJO36_10035 [Acidimicrobiia bacterium]|nr:hypothetical protein [Acidimicrobiia bacterium]
MSSGPFYVISLVLAIAGVAKLRNPVPTTIALGPWASPALVRFIGFGEIAVAAFALTSGGKQAGWIVTVVYLAFTVWSLRRRSASCGCFGSNSEVGTTHIVANVLSTSIAFWASTVETPGLLEAMAADWSAAGSLLASVTAGAVAVVLLLNRPSTNSPDPPTRDFRFNGEAELVSRGWLEELTLRTTGFAQTAVSRRAFLGRAALVGTALAIHPGRYILKPGTAYAAICDCQGTDCACGSLCCDGYTEFCCTIYGENTCPPGSIAAGWWKADGSGFCDIDGAPQPRYYIDCNAECTGGCTCVNGFCDSSCVFCTCECGNGECGNRKACCTKFRYGQCNQDTTCIGPIVCRVITCVAPWVWDPSCGTTSATDNNTAFHDAACLHTDPAPAASVPGGIPVVGDWNGDGFATPGIFRDGTWYLSNSLEGVSAELVFDFGQPGDIPVVGDWNGDGRDTVGVFRAGVWMLRNQNTPGAHDIRFVFGDGGDTPVVGDWSGDNIDNPGIVRNGIWYLRYSLSSGPGEHSFPFGLPTDYPLAGDFNGDGFASPALFRNGMWFIRNRNDFGPPDIQFAYGESGDIPLVGPWNNTGVALPLIVRAEEWHLRESSSTGPGNLVLNFGTRANAGLPR